MNIKFFALTAIVLSSVCLPAMASADQEHAVKEIDLVMCSRPQQFEDSHVYVDEVGWNNFVPLTNVQLALDSQKNLIMSSADGSNSISLGQPLRSWVEPGGECNGYQVTMNGPAKITIEDKKALLPSFCMDNQGVFPHPATCRDHKVTAQFTEANKQFTFQCKERIQESDGSGGHAGSRVSGDCFSSEGK